jgi:hypothetical protein
LEDFLRWTISGYNISNAVGYWCYYGSNRPVQSHYIDDVPTTEDIEAALRNEARIWREGDDWSQAKFKGQLVRFDKEYYGKLESLRGARTQKAVK